MLIAYIFEITQHIKLWFLKFLAVIMIQISRKPDFSLIFMRTDSTVHYNAQQLKLSKHLCTFLLLSFMVSPSKHTKPNNYKHSALKYGCTFYTAH